LTIQAEFLKKKTKYGKGKVIHVLN